MTTTGNTLHTLPILTKRERQFANLRAEGKSTSEIAKTMGISRTYATQLRHTVERYQCRPDWSYARRFTIPDKNLSEIRSLVTKCRQRVKMLGKTKRHPRTQESYDQLLTELALLADAGVMARNLFFSLPPWPGEKKSPL